MICLADNDVILKLAAWDLLDEALNTLDTSIEEVFVLATAKYQISGKRDSAKKYGDEGVKRALAFIETAKKTPEPSDKSELDALLAVDCDVTTKAAFGSRDRAEKPVVTEFLSHRVNELR